MALQVLGTTGTEHRGYDEQYERKDRTMSTSGKTPQAVDAVFTAPIQKDGAFATYLTVPGSAELFGTRRPVEVGGTIDGQPFTATCMPSGVAPHWLPLRATLCKVIGEDQAGVEVPVQLRQRFSRRTRAVGGYESASTMIAHAVAPRP